MLGGPLSDGRPRAGGPNIALGDPPWRAKRACAPTALHTSIDGDQSTYWRAPAAPAPVGTGRPRQDRNGIDEVVLKLPYGWERRDQTLSIQGRPTAPASLHPEELRHLHLLAPRLGEHRHRRLPQDPDPVRPRVAVTANTGWQAAQLSELGAIAAAASSTNLAAGKPPHGLRSHRRVRRRQRQRRQPGQLLGEHQQRLCPSGSRRTSAPPSPWTVSCCGCPPAGGARSQTLKIQGSTNGTDFTDLTASRAYAFDTTNDNGDPHLQRHHTLLRVLVTAEHRTARRPDSRAEIYGLATGDTQPPTAPANLAYTEPRHRPDPADVERRDRQHRRHRLRRLR